MDPEQQREIASMGGRASHGGRGRFYEDEGDYRGLTRYSQSHNDSDREDQGREDRGGNHRGFASMDPEERREIARRGGQSSNGGRSRSDQDWSRGHEDH